MFQMTIFLLKILNDSISRMRNCSQGWCFIVATKTTVSKHNFLLTWRYQLWQLKINLAWQFIKWFFWHAVLDTNICPSHRMCWGKAGYCSQVFLHCYLEGILKKLDFGLRENIYSAVHHNEESYAISYILGYIFNTLPNSDLRYVWKNSYFINWISQN